MYSLKSRRHETLAEQYIKTMKDRWNESPSVVAQVQRPSPPAEGNSQTGLCPSAHWVLWQLAVVVHSSPLTEMSWVKNSQITYLYEEHKKVVTSKK